MLKSEFAKKKYLSLKPVKVGIGNLPAQLHMSGVYSSDPQVTILGMFLFFILINSAKS